MVLDLDRFKTVNESHGYQIGDRLLCVVAARMVERLRDIDTVARLGADEFGILLEDLAGADDAERVARSLAAALAEPFNVGGKREIYSGASIGVTLFPDDGDDADRLLQNAETALNQAKTSRGATVFYTSLLTTAAQARIELEANLRLALERDEFILHYQPLVTIAADRVKGVEALVRWVGPGGSPIGTTIPPNLFIPVAEQTGLIVPLGEWVLRTACRQMRAWLQDGLVFDFVSVNLSPVQFLEPDLPERVATILAETGLPADCLELEITEGVLLERTEESQARLARLKALGVRLAIDDFGIGYSSLGYLKRLPIDKLKIDKSFIDDLPDDPANVKIVTAVISLAHSLRLEVLAEGIEKREQWLFLRRQGCDSAQGFLFSKPLPASELPDAVHYINKRQGRSRRAKKAE
jgi:diguanylate cyclase (GGDEF)-like protein